MSRRYFWITLVLILGLGVGAGLGAYFQACDPELHRAAERRDVETWLRHEFRLTETQMAAIRRLQGQYEEECEQHCAAINAARQALRELEQRGASPSAVQTQQAVVRAKEAFCEQAITVHLRRVAALMPPEQGQRYLDLLLPRVARFDHQHAPNLRLNH